MMRCYVLIAVLASLTAVVASIGIADDVNADDNTSLEPTTTNPGIAPETTDSGIAPETTPTTPSPSFRWTPTHPFTDTDRAIVGITCIVCGLIFIGAAIYGCARRQQMKKDKDAMYKKYMKTVGEPDLANDNPAFER